LFERAKAEEERLGYRIESGRYWEAAEQFSREDVARLDGLWLQALSGAAGGQRRQSAVAG
jgi:hypothetical protein